MLHRAIAKQQTDQVKALDNTESGKTQTQTEELCRETWVSQSKEGLHSFSPT